MTASSIDKRHAFNMAKSFMSNLAHGQIWMNIKHYQNQTLIKLDSNLKTLQMHANATSIPQIANEKAQSGAVTLLTFPNQNFWPAWHDSLQDISVSYDAQGPKHNHQRDLCSNVWALTDTAGHLFPSIYKFKAMKHLYVNIISMMYDNVSSYFACVWYESCASTIC